jgi:hypothetical protein
MVSLTSVAQGIKPDKGFQFHLRMAPVIWIATIYGLKCHFKNEAFIGQICEEAGDMSESG